MSPTASPQQLQISSEMSLPLQAVTQTFGILARKRVGKSNLAVVMAEEMYDAGLPWVAIDPKGDWYGLRSSANGQGPGLPVVVFGGEHGDVPLEPGAGHLIADLVVDQRLTCVLDVSEMFITSKAATQRFLTDFAARLYARNREPLHVFCEEADEYIPQQVRGDDAKMVSAFERLVKRGGFRGIGITLITQRSASLNNDVLTQVDTLMVLQTTGPPDKEAIKKWVVSHELGADVIKDLPDLKQGQGWVFSPGWLQILKKVHFRRRRTFDSGATPQIGVKAKPPATLADVDLTALRGRMNALVEKAKQEDPKELHKQIAELKRQLTARKVETVVEQHVKEIPVRVEVPVLSEDHIRQLDGAIQASRAIVDNILSAAARITDAINRAKFAQHQRPPVTAPLRSATARPVQAVQRNAPTEGLTAPQQRILDALAWWESVQVAQPRRSFVGMLANASIKSSAFKNNCGALRSAGLLTYPGNDTLSLTDSGRQVTGDAIIPQTAQALQTTILSRLPRPMGLLLEAAIRAYPQPISREDAGEQANASPTSSAFKNNLGALRSLGFIDYPDRDSVRALPVLFLE